MTPDEHAASQAEAAVDEAGRRARQVAPAIASLPTGVKNETLRNLADALLDEADTILTANERDVRAAERRRLPEPMVDRFTLTRPRLFAIAEGVRFVAALPDPVGEVLRGSRRPTGLVLHEVRVPIGVVALIYDSRPQLTIDAACLCLKSGNAALLLGGAEAHQTDLAVMRIIQRVLEGTGVPAAGVQLIDSTHSQASHRLMRLTQFVDVLIPRGPREFVESVTAMASVPTILMGAGNCHTFVERTAKLEMAADIAFNAKVQRPGVGNSMETLLVDRPIAGEFLPIVGTRLQAAGVELRGCDETRRILPNLRPATETDWEAEYLDLILAVRVVDGLDEAIAHITRYGTRHSEAIITQDYSAARRFTERVDAAAVYVNASTRFTDGFEFGLGAELGISTQKLHRRGPMGLRGLTSWKWIVQGEGQVRD